MNRNQFNKVMEKYEKQLDMLHNNPEMMESVEHLLHYMQVLTKGKVDVLKELKTEFFTSQPGKRKNAKKVEELKKLELQSKIDGLKLILKEKYSFMKIDKYTSICDNPFTNKVLCTNFKNSCIEKKCKHIIEYNKIKNEIDNLIV